MAKIDKLMIEHKDGTDVFDIYDKETAGLLQDESKRIDDLEEETQNVKNMLQDESARIAALDATLDSNLTRLDDLEETVAAMGAGALIVTADEDNQTSHSADDIYHHVRNGGAATLSYKGRYYNLLSVSDKDYAWFAYIDDGGSAHIVGILGNEVEPYEQTYATATYVDRAIETVVGDMETALDHIIVMQNSLIGGDDS